MDIKQAIEIYNLLSQQNLGPRIKGLRSFRDMVFIMSNERFLEGQEFSVKHYRNGKCRTLNYSMKYLESCIRDIVQSLEEKNALRASL